MPAGGDEPCLLSVVLPAKLGLPSVLPALAAWDANAGAAPMEVIILCPDGVCPTAEESAALGAYHRVLLTGDRDLHCMRALGIEHARGEYVVLAEDHCIPDPDFVSAVAARLKDGWDAVGPALRPGDFSTAWSQGSFLIGYGEWMRPARSAPTDVLCGWNGTIRTSLLRALGAELEDLLRMGAFAVRRLHAGGARFFLEERARMRHFDPPAGRTEFRLIALVGLGFGAMRTHDWPWIARLLYPLAMPMCAMLHWRRALRHYLRAGRAVGLSPSALAASGALAVVWATGEAIGSLAGIRRVQSHLWKTETKPVSWEAIRRSDERDQMTRSAQSARSSG